VVGEPRRDRYPGGNRGGKPEQKVKKPKPAAPPRPKREKIPPPKPFEPTDEQIKQVEERYLELATPTEFDGIRSQISKELEIPKKAVKKIVKELRDRQGIPSWWEMQTYKGDSEELAKIKAAYEPYLPLPPIGVHKTIADELSLKPSTVYQAIKAIRQEMNLPQYNDPSLHGIELLPKKRSTPTTGEASTADEEKTEPAAIAADTASQSEGAQANTGTPAVTNEVANESAQANTETPEATNEMATVNTSTPDSSDGTATAGTAAATTPPAEDAPVEPETSEGVLAAPSDENTDREA
jgi:hypothetical protein